MTEALGNLIKGLTGGGGSDIVASLIKVAQSQGGLEALLSKLGGANSPIGSQLASWIGTGANESVTGDEIEGSLGADTVAKVAEHAGVSTDEVKSKLADALPGLIDKISPTGQLPDLSVLSGMLGGLTGH